MATNRKQIASIPERTSLVIDRNGFKEKVDEMIIKGSAIKEIDIINEQSLESFLETYNIWDDYNSELLKSSFNIADNEYKLDYDRSDFGITFGSESLFRLGMRNPNDPNYKYIKTIRAIEAKITNLKQLINKVDLIPCIASAHVQPAQQSLDLLVALHPSVRRVASRLYKDGYYRQAMHDTYIALVEAVKLKSGQQLDGTPLMQKVFSKDTPILKVSDNADERLGYMWLFTGSVMGIRNPHSHHIIESNDPQRALEWLSFASILFRILDDSVRI